MSIARFVLRGMAVSVGLGVLLLYMAEDHSKQHRLRREQVVAVLKKVRREVSSTLVSLASTVKSLRKQLGKHTDAQAVKEYVEQTCKS